MEYNYTVPSSNCNIISVNAIARNENYQYFTSRYLVICFPMKAQIISTSKRARRICGLIWILALCVAILPTTMVSAFLKLF